MIRYCIALVAFLASSPAMAVAVPILNAGFEDPQLAPGAFTLGTVGPGWSAIGYAQNVGTANPTNATFATVPDGHNIAFAGSGIEGNTPYSGGFGQSLESSIIAGTRYTLSVDVGRRLDGVALSDFVVELMTGDRVLASGSFANDDIAAGAFRTLNIGYAALAGDTGQLSLRFRSLYAQGQGAEYRQTSFDNVRLDASIVAAAPEPSSWAMMVGGFALVGFTMRRRERASVRLT